MFDDDSHVTAEHKAELRGQLGKLADELDRHLGNRVQRRLCQADQTQHRLGHVPSVTNSRASTTFTNAGSQVTSPSTGSSSSTASCRKGGFDVVIGNPPYVSRRKVSESYTTMGFQTSGCPDIYATVVERCVNVCRTDGRTSMIVPLSLGFSSGFASLRSFLYEECDSLWYSSFGRIPSALFSFDTRVRNTIYLARKASRSPKHNFTTRLHRWFDSQRPVLFDGLSYAPFSPSAFGGLIPKLGTSRLLQGFESLLEDSGYRLQNDLTPARQGHHLHFKQTAYNWLTFCVDQPPVYDGNGHGIDHTGFSTVLFGEKETRDVSLLLSNGLLMFIWWIAVGDDFHLTQNNFTSIPLGTGQLGKDQRQRLSILLPELERAMQDNVVFKLNAGKNIGNYNLARCRHVTDKSDRVWLEALGLCDLWEDIEQEYALVVRTSFENEE